MSLISRYLDSRALLRGWELGNTFVGSTPTTGPEELTSPPGCAPLDEPGPFIR
jgi:hypothetical protein